MLKLKAHLQFINAELKVLDETLNWGLNEMAKYNQLMTEKRATEVKLGGKGKIWLRSKDGKYSKVIGYRGLC